MIGEQYKLEIEPESKEDRRVLSLAPADTDFLMYSGPLDDVSSFQFADFVDHSRKYKNVHIVMCTTGGVADSCYRMIRHLKRRYKKVSVNILGECKSAGTLFCLGADELVIGDFGELGPLDVQLFKPDEFLIRSSALVVLQALKSLSDRSLEAFERAFVNIRNRSGANITTRTASEIAIRLSNGLVSRIAEKIDPMYLGEIQRALDISLQYGLRLGAEEDTILHLATHYPSHSFIIDYEEACELFRNVRRPDDYLLMLWGFLSDRVIKDHGQDALRFEFDDGLMVALEPSQSREARNANSSQRTKNGKTGKRESKPRKVAQATTTN